MPDSTPGFHSLCTTRCGRYVLKSRPRYRIIDLILLQMLPWNRAIYHTNLTASHPPAKRWLGTNKRYATFQQVCLAHLPLPCKNPAHTSFSFALPLALFVKFPFVTATSIQCHRVLHCLMYLICLSRHPSFPPSSSRSPGPITSYFRAAMNSLYFTSETFTNYRYSTWVLRFSNDGTITIIQNSACCFIYWLE